MVSHFYGTIAMAMLVLPADYLFTLKKTAVARVFWLVGMPLAVFFALH